MAFEPPWMLAPAFLEQLINSGLDSDQAAQAIREIIRSTEPMPPWAAGVGPFQTSYVRYRIPEVERLDQPLDCETLVIPTSTIEAVGKMYGAVWAMPNIFRARVEFWTTDVRRLFPPIAIETRFRDPSVAPLVAAGLAGIKKGKFTGPLQAAKALIPQGSVQEIDRLRKAIAKEGRLSPKKSPKIANHSQ
jgi:hypothetical protein